MLIAPVSYGRLALFLFMGNWFSDRWSEITDYFKGRTKNLPKDFYLQLQCADVIWENWQTDQDFRCLLEKCAPLAALLYKRADAFSMGEVQVLNRRTQNDVRGENKDWQILIDTPNRFQTKSEFLRQLRLYLDMSGWCYALPIYPEGITDRPSSIWLLPPWCVDVQLIQKPIHTYSRDEAVRKVFFTSGNKRIELDERNLILFRDGVTVIDEYTLLPEGKMKSLKEPVTNLIAIAEANATLVQNKGPMTVISSESKDATGPVSMTKNEKEQVQDDFKRTYGLTRGQSQHIISTAAIKVQEISWDVKKLGLSEAHIQHIKDMCDVYNYPFPLSAHSDQSTYNNVTTADRLLYQNSIIPESRLIFEQFNAGLKTVEKNIELCIIYDKLPALQATEKEKADTLISQNSGYSKLYDENMITPNEWLEAIGRNKSENPDFNLYKYQREYTVQQIERESAKQKTEVA